MNVVPRKRQINLLKREIITFVCQQQQQQRRQQPQHFLYLMLPIIITHIIIRFRLDFIFFTLHLSRKHTSPVRVYTVHLYKRHPRKICTRKTFGGCHFHHV